MDVTAVVMFVLRRMAGASPALLLLRRQCQPLLRSTFKRCSSSSTNGTSSGDNDDPPSANTNFANDKRAIRSMYHCRECGKPLKSVPTVTRLFLSLFSLISCCHKNDSDARNDFILVVDFHSRFLFCLFFFFFNFVVSRPEIINTSSTRNFIRSNFFTGEFKAYERKTFLK